MLNWVFIAIKLLSKLSCIQLYIFKGYKYLCHINKSPVCNMHVFKVENFFFYPHISKETNQFYVMKSRYSLKRIQVTAQCSSVVYLSISISLNTFFFFTVFLEPSPPVLAVRQVELWGSVWGCEWGRGCDWGAAFLSSGEEHHGHDRFVCLFVYLFVCLFWWNDLEYCK